MRPGTFLLVGATGHWAALVLEDAARVRATFRLFATWPATFSDPRWVVSTTCSSTLLG